MQVPKILSEGYEQRVALPLAILAALCLLFILVSDHNATVSLRSTSQTNTSKKLVKSESAPKVKVVNDAQELNSTVKTEDMSIGESPMTISTASPQASSTSSSGSDLQSASSTSGSSSTSSAPSATVSASPVTSNQPSAAEIENIINGTTNTITNISTKTTKGVNDLLSNL